MINKFSKKFNWSVLLSLIVSVLSLFFIILGLIPQKGVKPFSVSAAQVGDGEYYDYHDFEYGMRFSGTKSPYNGLIYFDITITGTEILPDIFTFELYNPGDTTHQKRLTYKNLNGSTLGRSLSYSNITYSTFNHNNVVSLNLIIGAPNYDAVTFDFIIYIYEGNFDPFYLTSHGSYEKGLQDASSSRLGAFSKDNVDFILETHLDGASASTSIFLPVTAESYYVDFTSAGQFLDANFYDYELEKSTLVISFKNPYSLTPNTAFSVLGGSLMTLSSWTAYAVDGTSYTLSIDSATGLVQVPASIMISRLEYYVGNANIDRFTHYYLLVDGQGYNLGYTNGYSYGFSSGVNSVDVQGAYQNGYNDGYLDGNGTEIFAGYGDLLISVGDVPISVLASIFDNAALDQVFGFNLKVAFFTILTVVIVVFVIKKVTA